MMEDDEPETLDAAAEIDEREDLREIAQEWLTRITKRVEERDKGWGVDAEAAEGAFIARDSGDFAGMVPDFNILYSNTETICSAIFNSTPSPDIRERHLQGDQPARRASDVQERIIATQIDDGALTEEMERTAQEAYVTGRGLTRVRLEPDMRVSYEAVAWRDFVHGKARRWKQVSWIAFRHLADREEVERLSDDDMMDRQPMPAGASATSDDDITIWEIWDKANREVLFIREDDGRMMNRVPDPYGLTNFYPIATPIQPIVCNRDLDPIVPYKQYQKQAKELDRLTKRLNSLIDGLRLRGVSTNSAQDIERLAEAEDNTIITASNLEALIQNGGLERAIMWWPIDRAIQVVVQLYDARERTKQTIYEITGIADIMRGASDPRETADAQARKAQWGSLRIRKLQNMIQRHIRELFVLTSELVARKFSDEAIMQAAGMQVDPETMMLIRDPMAHYRIDVESDSTIRADLTFRQGEMASFLQGTAQYFQIMAPALSQAPEAIGPALEVYASFARQHNLGRQAEDALDQLLDAARQSAQQGQEEQPNPAMEEIKRKAQESAARIQLDMGKLQIEKDKQERDTRMAELELALKSQDRDIKTAELDIKRAELDLKERELEIESMKAAAEIELETVQQRPVDIQ